MWGKLKQKNSLFKCWSKFRLSLTSEDPTWTSLETTCKPWWWKSAICVFACCQANSWAHFNLIALSLVSKLLLRENLVWQSHSSISRSENLLTVVQTRGLQGISCGSVVSPSK